jgi:hypothetical protein
VSGTGGEVERHAARHPRAQVVRQRRRRRGEDELRARKLSYTRGVIPHLRGSSKVWSGDALMLYPPAAVPTRAEPREVGSLVGHWVL